MSEEGTEGRNVDQRLIILGVFAVVAIGIVAAILIGRSGGSDSGGSSTGAEGCEEVEAPEPKPASRGYQETEHVRNYYATTRL